MFPLAVHNARTNDCQLSVRILSLPNLMNFLSHQLADTVRSVRGRQCILCLQFFCCAIRSNRTCEQNLSDAILFGKGRHILCTINIGFKVCMIRVSRSPVYRSKIKNHIVFRRLEIKLNRFPHIQTDIFYAIVFLNDSGHNAFFAGHHNIKIVNLIARLHAFTF